MASRVRRVAVHCIGYLGIPTTFKHSVRHTAPRFLYVLLVGVRTGNKSCARHEHRDLNIMLQLSIVLDVVINEVEKSHGGNGLLWVIIILLLIIIILLLMRQRKIKAEQTVNDGNDSLQRGDRINPSPSPEPKPVLPNSSVSFDPRKAKDAFFANIDCFKPLLGKSGEFDANKWMTAIVDLNNPDLNSFYQLYQGKWQQRLALWGITPDYCNSFVGMTAYHEMYTLADGNPIADGKRYRVIQPCWIQTYDDEETGRTKKRVVKIGIVEEVK